MDDEQWDPPIRKERSFTSLFSWVQGPIDLSKLRYCPDILSSWTVRVNNSSKCAKDVDLITLSSTYAEMPANAVGIFFAEFALANAVTRRLANIIEQGQPYASELVISQGLPTCPWDLKTLPLIKV